MIPTENLRDAIDMLKLGWQTNDVFWRFEDSDLMDFPSALNLYKQSLIPTTKEKQNDN